MILIDGPTIVEFTREVGISHLVWIPDSALGTWDECVSQTEGLTVLRSSREGEAIAIAGGLWLGGKRPLIAMQCTGFFEAGDALRNMVHDLKLPLFCIVGCRSYFAAREGSLDTAPTYAEPVLNAWSVPYTLIDEPTNAAELSRLYTQSQTDRSAHVLLLAE